MTNEQILKKAIEKAVKNGWKRNENNGNIIVESDYAITELSWGEYYEIDYNDENIVYQIIFSHDFAKAFWGQMRVCQFCGGTKLNGYGDEYAGFIKCENDKCDFESECTDDNHIIYCEEWMYHLQQMVLEEDPIKYLEEFI